MLGILLGCKDKPKNDARHFSHFAKPGSVLEILVVEELKPNKFYLKYIGKVKRVGLQRTSGKTLIRLRKGDSLRLIRLNDKIYCNEIPIEFAGPINPGAFDYGQFMNKKGIYHQLTLGNFESLLRKPKHISLQHKALILRDKILKSLEEKGFSTEAFSIVQALLLGQKKDLSEETKRSYQNAGAMHILAISGLHIGILLMLLNTLLKPIANVKYGKELKCSLLLASLWSFAYISGLSSSVVRATSLFSLLTIGAQFGRTSQTSNFLFLALFLSLVFKPLILFDLGFQFSYAAVFGIIGISPLFKAIWIPRTRIVKYFWNLICVSIAAQLAVLPLSLYYFHHFSALFLVSSICVIPLLGLVLGLGYLMLILDQMGWLFKRYVSLYESIIRSMNFIMEKIGSYNDLSFQGVFFSLPLLLIGYLLIISLYYWVKCREFKQTVGVLLAILLVSSFLLYEKWSVQKSEEFVVFHQFRKSLMVRRYGDMALIFSKNKKENIVSNVSVREYEMCFLELQVKGSEQFRNFFSIGDNRIMLVDDTTVLTDFDPDIIVLKDSPKINLERLLVKMKPGIIVADGSNFSSYKSLWEKTAKKQGVRYHDTAKDGAFTLEIGSW